MGASGSRRNWLGNPERLGDTGAQEEPSIARPSNVQLRPLCADETTEWTRRSQALATRMDPVRRARALLAVAAGQRCIAACAGYLAYP